MDGSRLRRQRRAHRSHLKRCHQAGEKKDGAQLEPSVGLRGGFERSLSRGKCVC